MKALNGRLSRSRQKLKSLAKTALESSEEGKEFDEYVDIMKSVRPFILARLVHVLVDADFDVFLVLAQKVQASLCFERDWKHERPQSTYALAHSLPTSPVDERKTELFVFLSDANKTLAKQYETTEAQIELLIDKSATTANVLALEELHDDVVALSDLNEDRD